MTTWFPEHVFKVAPDQRRKFETNELMRRLSREFDVKYAGNKEKSHEERIIMFQNSCRVGRAEISFTALGINYSLRFFPPGDDVTGLDPSYKLLVESTHKKNYKAVITVLVKTFINNHLS